MSKIKLIVSSLILAFFGGYFDAYSLLYRGGKFTFMQTGNMINLSLDIVNKNYENILLAIFILCAFIFGIILSYFIEHVLKCKNCEKYIHIVLLCIIFILIIPNYFFDKTTKVDLSWIAIFSLSVIGGILLESFRIYIVSFAPTMMTNNTKIMVHTFLDGITKKEKGSFKKAFLYFGIILTFIFGVVSFALINAYTNLSRLAPIVGQIIIIVLLVIEIHSLKISKKL